MAKRTKLAKESKSKPSEIDAAIDRGDVELVDSSPAQWKRPCGAHTKHNHDKNGGRCQMPAGFGTDHVGEGRCKYHGGCNTPPSRR